MSSGLLREPVGEIVDALIVPLVERASCAEEARRVTLPLQFLMQWDDEGMEGHFFTRHLTDARQR